MAKNHAVVFTVGFTMGMATVASLLMAEKFSLWLTPIPFGILLIAVRLCGRLLQYDRGQSQ